MINAEELCNDVIVLDSDILWIKDLDVRDPLPLPEPTHRRPVIKQGGRPDPIERPSGESVNSNLCPGPMRYKYCLSSMDNGAWYGDITK